MLALYRFRLQLVTAGVSVFHVAPVPPSLTIPSFEVGDAVSPTTFTTAIVAILLPWALTITQPVQIQILSVFLTAMLYQCM